MPAPYATKIPVSRQRLRPSPCANYPFSLQPPQLPPLSNYLAAQIGMAFLRRTYTDCIQCLLRHLWPIFCMIFPLSHIYKYRLTFINVCDTYISSDIYKYRIIDNFGTNGTPYPILMSVDIYKYRLTFINVYDTFIEYRRIDNFGTNGTPYMINSK